MPINSNLKIFLFISLAVVLTFILYGYLKAVPGVGNEKDNRPQIEITPQVFDFGGIDYGQVVEYTFQVKNLGRVALEITRVATSCACTTAQINQEKIVPGEVAELKVIYDTGAMTGAHAKGEQERIIYIKSNDPKSPQVEVTIYADVK